MTYDGLHRDLGPPAETQVVENLDEMLTYALALLKQVFLAHKQVL